MIQEIFTYIIVIWAFYKAVKSILAGVSLFKNSVPACSAGCSGCRFSQEANKNRTSHRFIKIHHK